MKILLAIHYEEVWDFLSRRLKRRGFDVVVATDGQEAIDKSRTAAPDIVVIDPHLPTIHGWTVIRMIRDDPAITTMPIIALIDVGGGGGDRKERIAAHYTDCSPSPVDFPDLLSKIERYGPKS